MYYIKARGARAHDCESIVERRPSSAPLLAPTRSDCLWSLTNFGGAEIACDLEYLSTSSPCSSSSFSDFRHFGPSISGLYILSAIRSVDRRRRCVCGPRERLAGTAGGRARTGPTLPGEGLENLPLLRSSLMSCPLWGTHRCFVFLHGAILGLVLLQAPVAVRDSLHRKDGCCVQECNVIRTPCYRQLTFAGTAYQTIFCGFQLSLPHFARPPSCLYTSVLSISSPHYDIALRLCQFLV